MLINSLKKCKIYYHVTLPDPPKKNVVYVMQRCLQTAEEKFMPFIQFVGDQPDHALILKE